MTTAPAVKAALLTALQQSAALTGVHIQRHLPAELPDSPEHIYITTDTGHRRVAGRGSIGHRTYEINLVCEVIGNDTAEAAEARVRQLEDAGESVIDAGLSRGRYTLALNTGDLDDALVTSDGWIMRCRPSVSVRDID